MVMLVAVLMVESNYMALCFMECSWNTEQADPLGLLIKQSVCPSVCVSVCMCVYICVWEHVACLSLEHIITSW